MKVMLLQILTNILSPPPPTKHPKDESTVRKINFDISPPNIISHMSLTMPNMIHTLNSSNDSRTINFCDTINFFDDQDKFMEIFGEDPPHSSSK